LLQGIAFIPLCQEVVKIKMSSHNQKDHYKAIEDVHVNLDNRNHAIDEYGYGPMNPNEKSEDFWQKKADLWDNTIVEAKKSRCYNCAAFNQTPEILKAMGEALGPVGDKIVETANLGFCELFYFKCAGERTCDAWLTNGPLKEEAPANATGPAIPGTGDDPQAFPRGEPLKKYKKKTNKEQYAQTMDVELLRRKTPMMESIASYMKSKNITEAPLLQGYGRRTRFNKETGRKISAEDAGAKIARVDKEHDLHHSYDLDGSSLYTVRNRNTGISSATIYGKRNYKTGVFDIDTTDSTGKGPKVHKVYKKILQSGHSTALVGHAHTSGGQKLWQNLSKERGVNIHGWIGGKKGKPVNLDPRDPEETHVSYDEVERDRDPSAREILKTKLVASISQPKKVVRRKS